MSAQNKIVWKTTKKPFNVKDSDVVVLKEESFTGKSPAEMLVSENSTVRIESEDDVGATWIGLQLNIPVSSKVIWAAKFHRSDGMVLSAPAVRIKGGGEFEIVAGGEISIHDMGAGAIVAGGDEVSRIVVSGGSVEGYGRSGAILGDCDVFVRGGEVFSHYCAIGARNVEITGGKVSGNQEIEEIKAIRAKGELKISGGEIKGKYLQMKMRIAELENMPEREREENIRQMIKEDWEEFKSLPEKWKTFAICKFTVEMDAWALEYVPDDLKTAELCQIAVRESSYALKYVPKHLVTEDLCEIVVKGIYGGHLDYIPEDFKTEKICKIAVENSGYDLEFVPENLKTLELCEIAVNKRCGALEYVPKHLMTDEFCEKALELCKKEAKESHTALSFMPKRFKTPEVCKIAVENHGRALKWVPGNLKTLELCEIAVKRERSAIKYVPKKFQNKLKEKEKRD